MEVNTAKMIPSYLPTVTGREEYYIRQLLQHPEQLKDYRYSGLCREMFEGIMGSSVLLTNACTSALEIAALQLGINDGDEVIIPSFTHVGTANAFVIRGAALRFVDIRPDTMNINEGLIEEAITSKTKAIVVMHYAAVGAEMEAILQIADQYNLPVIEDAAHGILAKRNGKYLGTFGRFGAMSFDQTKNINSVKGGLLMVNNQGDMARAEIHCEGGTDRRAFMRGERSFYQWVEKGSNCTMDELCAAYLYGQMESAEEIIEQRRALWYRYNGNLKGLSDEGRVELSYVPQGCEHNGHIFYFKTQDKVERNKLMQYLREEGIETTFHYIPLHSSAYGMMATQFVGEDKYTTLESERLLRLPLYYGLTADVVDRISETVIKFYKN